MRDDGTDGCGLPFPFDLEGRLKVNTVLVQAGVPKTPTLDSASAKEFGMHPTANAVGGQEAHGLNLFMEPGALTEDEILGLANGGIWISRLDRIEVYDPVRVRLRALARGVRQIAGGALTQPALDFRLDDSVLRIFSDLRGIGRDTYCRLSNDGLLGGISAPAVLIGDAPGLERLPQS